MANFLHHSSNVGLSLMVIIVHGLHYLGVDKLQIKIQEEDTIIIASTAKNN